MWVLESVLDDVANVTDTMLVYGIRVLVDDEEEVHDVASGSSANFTPVSNFFRDLITIDNGKPSSNKGHANNASLPRR